MTELLIIKCTSGEAKSLFWFLHNDLASPEVLVTTKSQFLALMSNVSARSGLKRAKSSSKSKFWVLNKMCSPQNEKLF